MPDKAIKALIKSAFSIVGAVVLLFAAPAVFIARSTADMMIAEAERTVKSVVKETTGRIDRLMTAVEAATLNSAREVGGDLYDFLRKGNRLYFIIGDASGKGVPAALFSFVAGTVFRMSCRMDLNPGEIIERINEALVRNNATSMFVTVFVCVLDLGTGELSYGCAGHNPPVIIPPDGQARLLEVKRQPPTGAVEGTAYAVQTAQIEKGSKIVVYTDGVTEAERADHGQFGDGRLLHFAEGCAEASISDTAVGLLKAVDEFVDGAEQSDDIAILAIGL